MREFRYTYANVQTTVVFDDTSMHITNDDTVNIINYHQVRYWYSNVFYTRRSYNDPDPWRNLIIASMNDQAATVHTNFFASAFNQVFDHLIGWIAKEFPDQSLEHLSEAEAYAILKLKNPYKYLLPILAITTGVGSLLAWRDGGRDTVFIFSLQILIGTVMLIARKIRSARKPRPGDLIHNVNR